MRGLGQSCSTNWFPWFAALAMAGSCAVDAAGPVLINEVLADNRRAVPVADRFPDFVELFNTSAAAVDLGGATLADDSAAQVPLVFPSGTRLGPGGRLVVWCDRVAGLPAPQAAFGIGATSDYLQLRGPSGQVWDELRFGLQLPDYSIGRTPDGTTHWRLNRPTPATANQEQPLGSPDRLFLNEWMAAPLTGDDWIEIYNGLDQPVALEGMRLTDRTTGVIPNRPIPALSFIGAGGFVQLFASDLRSPDADHLDFRLSSSGETLSLFGSGGLPVLDRVTFGLQRTGESQGRAPDGGEALVTFPAGQTTPGLSNARNLTRIVISEVLSHTDPPQEDAIELHNPTDSPIDVSHWWLSDSAEHPQRFRVPAGTVIPAKGFWVAYEYQFGAGPAGFSLNSYEGDEVWLSAGDSAGRLTGERAVVRFGPLDNGVSAGRVPTTGGTDFAPLSRPTFGVDAPLSLPQFRLGRGTSNSAPRQSPVQFSELFFATSGVPSTATEAFVEIHNSGGQAAFLYDPAHSTNAWRLRGAVRFDFPTGVILEAGARLLIAAFDPTTEPHRLQAFREAHHLESSTLVLGPYTGNLAAWTTGLELQRPDVPEGPTKPRPGFVPYVRAERIDYQARRESGWPFIGAGSGLALARRGPDTFSNDAAAWIAMAPSPGRSDPNEPGVDSDRDGMPDAWETAHGLDPERAADAAEDPDGDGANHRQEYLANTHPHDSASVLKLAITASATGLTLTFQAAPRREHRLEAQSTGTGTWNVMTQYSRAETAVERRLILAPATSTGWFRVSVPSAP
ncbi:MAG: lamin tail domain-containing protein [Verrucomicrobiales bacterium]|nr:lamin tail domain-containing protein [Verrucomicrobiales bacterium]